MSGASIYRSAADKAAVLALYDTLLAQLNLPYDEFCVPTRFGKTHGLAIGPVAAPPVLYLHGGNSFNPGDLAAVAGLARTFRIYAPDLIGQPGKSAETRLSADDPAAGNWLVDVLDALNLPALPVIGCSFGAALALRLAEVAPERISKAALYVPGGIVGIPPRMMLNIAAGYVWYGMLRRNQAELLRHVTQSVSGSPVDETLLAQVTAVFQHMRVETGMPRATNPARLRNFTAPVLVIAAERDAIFPAQAVISQAKTLFRNLAAAEVLPDSAHYVSGPHSDALTQRIQAFLEAA